MDEVALAFQYVVAMGQGGLTQSVACNYRNRWYQA
jgi:hypothetical protein